MEAKKNVPVNKSSTVETITTNDPAIFNGMISALEGLTDVTDKGIERVINAVNGLSKATTATSDPAEVQAATSKALARAFESSERIETIEIKEEPLTTTEKTKVTPKAESINIGKALSGFKQNKADFYQPNDSAQHSIVNESNEHVLNDNRATNTQSQTNTSTVSNSAGGRGTVFNQLNNIESTQLNTHEKVSDIDNKLDNSTTSVNNNEQSTSTAKATKAPRSAKAATVGAPTFDHSHITNNSTSDSEKAAHIESEKTKRVNAYSARKKTNNNKTDSTTKTSGNKSTSEAVTNNNTRSTASEIAESHRLDRVEVTLKDNATALTTSAKSSKDSITQTASKLVSATESVTELTESVKSQAQGQSKQTTSNNTNNATLSSSKSESNNSQTKYYKDEKNRLRTGSGRYASKEEKTRYEQAHKSNGSRTIRSRIGKHIKNRNRRQVIGSAFLGSAYPALEEAYQTSQSAKFAAHKRGLTSVDGFKEYAAKKGKTYANRATDVAQSTKDTYSSVKGVTSNVLSKIKSSIFRKNDTRNLAAGTTSSNSNNSAVTNSTATTNESTSKAPATQAVSPKKRTPSTVDGVVKSPAIKVLGADGTGSNDNKSIEKYLTNNSSKSVVTGNSKNSKQPLTNSVFIGAQKSTDGLTKKLSKEYHDAHMLKVDKLIKAIEDKPMGGGGEGGGSIIDDALDFNRDRKRRKRNKQSGRPKSRGKLGRAKDFLKSGRFFGGGAKVAGAIGAGAVGAGAVGAAAVGSATAAPATKAAGKASLAAGGGLAGTARLISKAIPLLAIASTAYDAYDGFTNKEKQQETFNLKSTQEANIGQKSAMAAGSVLDLGGLTSGAAGLLGDGLGALGFEGAKDALTFDSGDIAKAIYDKSETLINSGTGIATSLGEGDFSGAASNAMTFLQTALPTFGMFNDYSEDKGKSEKSDKTDKTNQVTTTEKKQGSISRIKTESDKSTITDKPQNITATSQSLANGAEQVNALNATDKVSPIANASKITPIQAESVIKRESVTDVSTLANKTNTTNTSNNNQDNNNNSNNGEPIIITENAKTIAALKEISKKLDLNRETDKSNNRASSAGINSMPTNIPANFSDPFMERLANE